MGYTPENNPYIPGDPYSYDLAWMVQEVKAAQQVGQNALQYANNALQSQIEAQQAKDLSMAWAIGEDDGGPVPPGEPQYNNHSKYWAEQSADHAASAMDSAQTAGDYVDTIDHIEDQVQSDLADQNDRIAVLEGRMDLFASLPPGSTAGNAELLDIRVDTEGYTWPSAGDSVRGQFDLLNNFLQKDNTYSNLYDGITTPDTSWNCWGAVVSSQSTTDYLALEMDIPVGTNFICANYDWAENSFSAFTDNSYNKIELIKNTKTADAGWVYEIPAGATKACVSFNAYSGSRFDTFKSAHGIVWLAGKTVPSVEAADYPIARYFADDLRLHSMGDEKLSDLITPSVIYEVKKDGTGDFTAIKDALDFIYTNNIMDAKVYIGQGTWDICDELGAAYMEAVTSNPATWGLVLKNRVHLIGSSNAVIQAIYTGTNVNTHEYFSAFNAGPGGFILENINIRDDNIRYSVHDDRGNNSYNEHYENKYINCSMIHTNGRYPDCIGGGLGIDGLIEIRNCYFEGDAGAVRLAYYHGNNYIGETDAQCKIFVTGCYFAGLGTFRMTKYGDSTKMSTAYVSNNSFGTAPQVTAGSYAPQNNVEIIEWNNVVRP